MKPPTPELSCFRRGLCESHRLQVTVFRTPVHPLWLPFRPTPGQLRQRLTWLVERLKCMAMA